MNPILSIRNSQALEIVQRDLGARFQPVSAAEAGYD
jgi:hypothetical protein